MEILVAVLFAMLLVGSLGLIINTVVGTIHVVWVLILVASTLLPDKDLEGQDEGGNND